MKSWFQGLAFILAIAAMSVGAAIGANPGEPGPRLAMHFFSGVATYRDGRFVALLVGQTRFTSCREALMDSAASIQRSGSLPNKGAAIGLCIPVPVYDARDLTSDIG